MVCGAFIYNFTHYKAQTQQCYWKSITKLCHNTHTASHNSAKNIFNLQFQLVQCWNTKFQHCSNCRLTFILRQNQSVESRTFTRFLQHTVGKYKCKLMSTIKTSPIPKWKVLKGCLMSARSAIYDHSNYDLDLFYLTCRKWTGMFKGHRRRRILEANRENV